MADQWKEKAIRIQEEYRQMFCFSKVFNLENDKNVLKSYLGVALYQLKYDSNENLTDVLENNLKNPNVGNAYIERYFEKYDENQQETIELILKKLYEIESKCLILSQVYLCICETDKIVVVFYCETAAGIQFIDTYGRVYKGWKDFVENNKLPSFQYLAPKYGIYRQEPGSYECFRTPATNLKNKLWLTGDCLAGVVGLGTASLGLLAVAPVTVACSTVGVGLYCVGRSTAQLVDRKQHSQTIVPNNSETVHCYLNILGSVVTSVSSVAVLKAEALIKFFSEGTLAAGGLKALNIAAILAQSGCISVHIYDIVKRIIDKRFTVSDILALSVEIFFLFGSIMNFKVLSDLLSGVPKVNPTHIRFAKLATSEQLLDCIPIMHTDLYQLFTRLTKFSYETAAVIFKLVFPQAVRIWNCCCDLVQAIRKYNNKIIDMEQLVKIVIPRMEELCAHLKHESQQMKQNIKLFLQKLQRREITNQHQSTNSCTNKESIDLGEFNHKIILHGVKYLLDSSEVTPSSISILSAFHEGVLFVTNKLSETISLTGNQSAFYDSEKLEMALNAILEESGNSSEKKSCFIDKKLVSSIINDLEYIFDNLLARVHAQVNIINMNEALKVMQNVSKTLTSEAKYVLDKKSLQIPHNSNAKDALKIWTLSKLALNKEKMITELMQIYRDEGSFCDDTDSIKFVDMELRLKCLVSIKKKFFEKTLDCEMGADEIEKIKILKYAYRFMEDKFDQEILRMENETHCNQVLTRTQRKSVFRDVFKKFDDDQYLNNLVLDYLNFYDNSKNDLNDEDILDDNVGNIKIYNVDCVNSESNFYYIDKAANLFGFPINDVEIILRNNSLLILECFNDRVFFYFNENKALIVLCKENLL